MLVDQDEATGIPVSPVTVDLKDDGSPLTNADRASHEVIQAALSGTGYPIMSEEGKQIPFEERSGWNRYWLVDPLDGTKEFIKRNGEFTVNIALIEDGQPILGVIQQPTTQIALVGIIGDGVYRFAAEDSRMIREEARMKLNEGGERDLVTVIASRSHRSPETESFIESLRGEKRITTVSAGSSLKFCLIAEGKADIYPRFAPTMEWDTAAGHAILKSAGKNVYLYPGGKEMQYNKPLLTNDWFIAR